MTSQINPSITSNLPGTLNILRYEKKIDSRMKIRKGMPKKNRGDFIPFTKKYNNNKRGKISLKISIIFLTIKSAWKVHHFI